jgi:ribosomal protein S18 acetylase RimI-like enzyme
MDIDRAAPDDLLNILEVFATAIREMRSQGIFQWDEVYPNADVIENDVAAGSLYVIRDESRIVACVTFDTTPSPEWSGVQWRYQEPALIVHRLCVHPERQGKGLARRLMDFAESAARERGFASIRLDTYIGNPRAVRLYEERGYTRAGQVVFPRRPLPFDCFESPVNRTGTFLS